MQFPEHLENTPFIYRKVASSRPVYYSILDHFVQRSQYISIKIPLHKQSENPWVCYQARQSTAHDFTVVWAALWNFQGQAWAGWELSILSWMVLLRPLRLLQRLGEPLSILLHKHTLCTKTDRGSSSLCSSLRGLNSTIQLRIDSYQPAQACPWKFHNPVYATIELLLLFFCWLLWLKT